MAHLKAALPGNTFSGLAAWVSHQSGLSRMVRRGGRLTVDGPGPSSSSSIDKSVRRVSHSLTVRSTPQLSNLPPSAHVRPETLPLCAPEKRRTIAWDEMSCVMISVRPHQPCPAPPICRHAPPSQLPLASELRSPGGRARTSTASICPASAPTNGFANIRASFAALTARVRSRARANGCCSGSRLRDRGVGSPGRCGRCAAGSCWSTEIFCQRTRESVGSISVRRADGTIGWRGEKMDAVTCFDARHFLLATHAARGSWNVCYSNQLNVNHNSVSKQYMYPSR
jgi:hypothetical protein